MPSESHKWKTEWFDLIFRGLEITTWGQRIHNYDMQVDNMIKKGLNPNDFNDFLVLHKTWTMPHGWFWMWSERLLQKLLNRTNIRETTLFPRDMKRLTP
jgi:aspartyl/asparaginyl-tRNA synthetase